MPRNLPSLNALAALEAVLRHGSIARAATELRVSAAAVSQHIRGLEEQLGATLFLRGARGVTATDAARRLLPLLSESFDRLDEAARSVREGRARGRLNVSMLPSFAAGWFVPRLRDFERGFPDVELVLRADRHLVDFDREEVDVAIRHAAGPPSSLAHQLLFDELVFPVCSPALAYGAKPIRSAADLALHPLLHDLDAEPRQPELGWAAWFTRAGLPFPHGERALRFNDSMVLMAAAVDGHGIALGREPLVAELLARGQLIRPIADARSSERAYYAVGSRRAFRRPLVRSFVAWLSGARA